MRLINLIVTLNYFNLLLKEANGSPCRPEMYESKREASPSVRRETN